MEFFDQFEHTIDDKGRLVLPAAYREAFVGGGFLTLLGDNAALFTSDGWEKYRRRWSCRATSPGTSSSTCSASSARSPRTPSTGSWSNAAAARQGGPGAGGHHRRLGVPRSDLPPRGLGAGSRPRRPAADAAGLTLIDKFNALDFL